MEKEKMYYGFANDADKKEQQELWNAAFVSGDHAALATFLRRNPESFITDDNGHWIDSEFLYHDKNNKLVITI